jgi:hypothetical protein
MATIYRFVKTLTATVKVADDGEELDGLPVQWASEDQKRETAMEYVSNALSVTNTAEWDEYAEIEESDWELISADAAE